MRFAWQPSAFRAATPAAVVRDLSSQNAHFRLDAVRSAAIVAATLSDESTDRRAIIGKLAQIVADDADPKIRAEAVNTLGTLKAENALPAISIAIEDEHADVRQQALLAIADIGDLRARERVRRALTDDRPDVRFQAIATFVRLSADERDEAWEALRARLDDGDSEVLVHAAEIIAEFADQEHLPPAIGDKLAELCDHGVALVRASAAIALAESADLRGRRVISEVISGVLPLADPALRQAAFELAGEHNFTELLPHAKRLAFGFMRFVRDPALKFLALTMLLRWNDADAKAWTLRELQSRSYERRRMAMFVISRAQFVDAKPWIEGLLASAIDRDTAEDTLRELADASAMQPRHFADLG
jgi:HEAT repeat protein